MKKNNLQAIDDDQQAWLVDRAMANASKFEYELITGRQTDALIREIELLRAALESSSRGVNTV